MKRRWMATLLIACICGTLISGSAERSSIRSLTLMVYMCGSNLESQYGSASMDLMEMQGAGFDAERLNVLVMTGGAERWALGGDAGQTVIRRILPGGQQIVWRSELRDMGDPETLTQFLKYGKQAYPADDYALIFWDHGGGPLDGVCWDEMFSMDGLTLKELTEGIRDAWYYQKLSWIGFDACLMGTAEVAAALAPYADHMIASQETEPAAGWNYTFLKDADGDGKRTGRLIVDSYFDGQEGSGDTLTMACIDLSQIGAVVSGMDDFFGSADTFVSTDTFADLSRLRHDSQGFGNAVRALGSEDYDLVDLEDLVSRYGKDHSVLQAAIKNAVVYTRSSDEKACGLSVYHPYANKQKYLRSWRHDYHDLDFSASYIRYTERFGTILTGEGYVDWSGMETEYAGNDESGLQSFSLALTEGQAGEYVSGELMIMSGLSESTGRMALAPIAVEPVSVDDKGIVSAGYEGEALYVVDDAGEILTGPVSFLRSEDGVHYLVLAVYYDYSSNADTKQTTYVLYDCTRDPDTGDLTIIRSRVYDRASKTYTNRIAFSEEGFTNVHFREFIRYLPDVGKGIRGFEEWENFGGYMERPLELPCSWHLKLLKDWNVSDLYAVFQVTDSRQDTWCSIPVKMENPNESSIPVTCSLSGTADISVICSGVLRKTTVNPALQLNVQVLNTSDNQLDLNVDGIVLNGSRSVPEAFWALKLGPGEGKDTEWYLREEEIIGIDTVDTVDFTVRASVSGDWRSEPVDIPVHLELRNACVRAIAPIAQEPLDEYRGEDMIWQLMSMEQKPDGTLSGMIHAQNLRDEVLQIKGFLVINRVQTASNDSDFSFRLEPGTDAYIPFKMENRDTISEFGLRIAGDSRLYLMGVEQALEQAGNTYADQVEIYTAGRNTISGLFSDRLCVLRMPEGVKLQEAAQIPLAVLMDGEGVTVALEQMLIADDGIGLGLRLNNDTDRTVCLELLDPVINGEACEETFLRNKFDNHYNPVMPPHTRAVRCVSLELTEDMIAKGQVRELSFRIVAEGMMSGEVTIRLPDVEFGAAGGTYLSADQLTVTPSALILFEEKPAAIGEIIEIRGDHVCQVRAVAPIPEEQAPQVDYGTVRLCLLDWRQSDDDKGSLMPVTRALAGTDLKRDEHGWSAVFSGFTAMVQDHFIRVDETKLDESQWKLEPDHVYFYCEEGSLNPTGQLLLFDGGVSMYSSAAATVRIEDDTAALVDSSVSLNGWLKTLDSRNKVCLDDVVEAAVENRVFFGTDRVRYAGTLDYSDVHRLDVSETVSISLVPVESVPGEKCLSFSLFMLDGSREDVILSLDGRTVLDRTFIEAKND